MGLVRRNINLRIIDVILWGNFLEFYICYKERSYIVWGYLEERKRIGRRVLRIVKYRILGLEKSKILWGVRGKKVSVLVVGNISENMFRGLRVVICVFKVCKRIVIYKGFIYL